MKKNLLFILLGLMIPVCSMGQTSFSLSHESGEGIPNGAILNYIGEMTTSLLAAHVHVTNDAAVAKSVLVKKVILKNVELSMNTFCWAGSCYGPETYVSPTATELLPGQTATDFAGDYSPNMTEGLATIMYVWFDRDDPADSTYVIVNFNTEAVKNLSICNAMGSSVNGQTITVSDVGTGNIDFNDIRIINFMYDSVDVKVMKMINEGDTVAGSTNAFFWDKQYGPEAYESDAVTLQSTETFYNFIGQYHANSNNGESTITYKIYDVNNPDMSGTITVNYDVQGLGLNDYSELAEITDAYPNPADHKVNFGVYLKDKTADVRIVLRNLLGSDVKEIKVSGLIDQASINTSDLAEGLYVYSLVINEVVQTTKKLIIRH